MVISSDGRSRLAAAHCPGLRLTWLAVPPVRGLRGTGRGLPRCGRASATRRVPLGPELPARNRSSRRSCRRQRASANRRRRGFARQLRGRRQKSRPRRDARRREECRKSGAAHRDPAFEPHEAGAGAGPGEQQAGHQGESAEGARVLLRRWRRSPRGAPARRGLRATVGAGFLRRRGRERCGL